MVIDLHRIVRREFKSWGDFDKFDLFDELGVQYHHALVLCDHPVVKLLDPRSQTAYFEEHASSYERTMNESALDVVARQRVEHARTCIVEIGDEFGYGLFANEDMSEGTFIGEYSGLLTWKGYQPVVLAEGLIKGDPSSTYDFSYTMRGYDAPLNETTKRQMFGMLFCVPEPFRLMVDGSEFGGDTRFINHLYPDISFYRPDGSIIDGPNVEAIQGFHQGYFRKWLFTRQDIQRGDELRMDYGYDDWQGHTLISRLFFASKDGLFELQETETFSSVLV